MNLIKPFSIHLVPVAVSLILLTGCADLPQRCVKISSHPSQQDAAVIVASFPADLRAYTLVRSPLTAAQQADLKQEADIIATKQGRERTLKIDDFNRKRQIYYQYSIAPEPPARVVVSSSKIAPSLAFSPGSSNTVTMSLEALQEVTKLGDMPDNELKAYLAYLSFIEAHNRGVWDGSLTNKLNELMPPKK